MNLSSPVCRTCLGIISEGKNSYNIDEESGLIKNVRNIREMITFCVPELDIYISVNPSICETCLHVLTNVYNFKIRCMRVENAIRSYVDSNNVMEGSCVDLTNVVRQQILDTLKQKNWAPNLIQEYIGKVNKCLRISSKRNVTQGSFSGSKILGGSTSLNPQASHLNRSQSRANSNQNVTRNILNVPNETNNCLESFSEINRLLGCNITISPVSSHSNKQSSQNATSTESNITINKKLRSVSQTACSLSQSTSTNSPTNASIDTFQSAFLTAFNLMRTNTLDREEAVLKKAENNSNDVTKNSHAKFSKGTRSDPIRSSNNIVDTVKTQNSKVEASFQEWDNNAKRLLSRSGRSNYLGPKSKRKKGEKKYNIDIANKPQKRTAEVLEVNEGGFVEQENGTESIRLQAGTSSVAPEAKKVWNSSKKVSTINENTLKRKLVRKDITQEIKSKRKKLVVKLNSSLPYLHINKELTVRICKEKFLKCSFCNFVTLQKTELERHYEALHKICKLCSYKCFTKSELDVHLRLRHSDHLRELMDQYEENKVNHNCQLCNFVALSLFDLRDHWLRIHIKCNVNGRYKCPFEQCDEEDAIACNISKHIERKHDNFKNTSCPVCNYVAPSSHKLKIHVSSHCSVNAVTCSLCGVRFKTTVLLNKHMRRKHTAVDREKNLVGMACVPIDDYGKSLVTDEDGKITLDRPSNPTVETLSSEKMAGLEGICSFNYPSFSELLCVQTLEEMLEQDNDCTIIDELQEKGLSLAGKKEKKKSLINKRNKKKSRRVDSMDDSDDCMIICENQEIMTIDSSDDEITSENNSKRRKEDNASDDRCADIIEIEDETDGDVDNVICSNDNEISSKKLKKRKNKKKRTRLNKEPLDDREHIDNHKNLPSTKDSSPIFKETETGKYDNATIGQNTIQDESGNLEAAKSLEEVLVENFFQKTSNDSLFQSNTESSEIVSNLVNSSFKNKDDDCTVIAQFVEEEKSNENNMASMDPQVVINIADKEDDCLKNVNELHTRNDGKRKEASVNGTSAKVCKNIAPDVQDSENNVIISDSESEKSEAVYISERPKKSPEIVIKNKDAVGNIAENVYGKEQSTSTNDHSINAACKEKREDVTLESKISKPGCDKQVTALNSNIVNKVNEYICKEILADNCTDIVGSGKEGTSNEDNVVSKNPQAIMKIADKEEEKNLNEPSLRDDDKHGEASLKGTSVKDSKRVISDIQNLEDNLVISDSESDNSEAVLNTLDFELPMKSQEIAVKNRDAVVNMDSKITFEINEQSSSTNGHFIYETDERKREVVTSEQNINICDKQVSASLSNIAKEVNENICKEFSTVVSKSDSESKLKIHREWQQNKIHESNLLSVEFKTGKDREEISPGGCSNSESVQIDSHEGISSNMKSITSQEISNSSNDIIIANDNVIESIIEETSIHESAPSNIITELEKISQRIQSSPVSEIDSDIVTDYSITIENLIVQKKVSDADNIVLSAEIIKNNLESLDKSLEEFNNPCICSGEIKTCGRCDKSTPISNSSSNDSSGVPDACKNIVQSVSVSERESEINKDLVTSDNLKYKSDNVATKGLNTSKDKVIDEAASNGNNDDIENSSEEGNLSGTVRSLEVHNSDVEPIVIASRSVLQECNEELEKISELII